MVSPMATREQAGLAALLIRYFRSGWAFLVPYFAAFELYRWSNWPALPAPGHAALPSLLGVFIALHILNAALLLAALTWAATGWWSRNGAMIDRSVMLKAAVPWCLLALLFVIPGAYLEYPADTWMHLGRINEWRSCGLVGSFSDPDKASYFLAFSLIGSTAAPASAGPLALYYTGVCLVLCWQYYRLAVATGLGPATSFIFVLVNVTTAGNVTFSYYRYYGIASTAIASIAAVAIVRIALEGAQCGGFGPWRARAAQALSICALLFVIRYNHVQELGLAGVAVVAIGLWRLVAWRRWTIAFLLPAAVLLSLACIRLYPRASAIDLAYRPVGIMTSWYGFNILQVHSLAGQRMIQILGVFGIANLAVATILIRRNNVVGWITLTPVIALILPFVAIPLATALAQRPGNWSDLLVRDIMSFHRLLLGIPSGLAVVTGLDQLRRRLGPRWPGFGLMVVALFLFSALPPTWPFFNRGWNLIAQPPKDLCLTPLLDDLNAPGNARLLNSGRAVAATSGVSFVCAATGSARTINSGRVYFVDGCTPARDVNAITVSMSSKRRRPELLIATSPFMFFSPRSLAAVCSGHWIAQEAAFSTSGSPQLESLAARLGLPVAGSGPVATYWLTPRNP
jgi:hypothetical protein